MLLAWWWWWWFVVGTVALTVAVMEGKDSTARGTRWKMEKIYVETFLMLFTRHFCCWLLSCGAIIVTNENVDL
uniref:Uncharacterized protein n=1 Tax=Anopheles darlingi TaxID=43151 RepID=A0A2M4DRE5_ANODA